MADDDVAIGAGQRFPLAMDRPDEKGVGQLLPREQLGRLPSQREGGARRAAAQGVGGLMRHADDAAGGLHPMPLGQRLQKAALAVRRPAIVTRGGGWGIGRGRIGGRWSGCGGRASRGRARLRSVWRGAGRVGFGRGGFGQGGFG
ncbi:MAG: hypothetical protein DI547_11860 [Sphingobium sp.]|nr:MAG: hypothetical protein DI547_11860 [Sphingobium sp.]